ncbi:hypothetical protein KBC79_05685, partial [Candidatus Woesebacteria bacterium]|nr:hypothetical protein [Candidatus Woesebacteria bacterium]
MRQQENLDVDFDLDDLDNLLLAVQEVSNQDVRLTSQNFDAFLFEVATPIRRQMLEQLTHFANMLQSELALHQDDLVGRLRDIRGRDLVTLEAETVLDEEEPVNRLEAIDYTLDKIRIEKLYPIQELLRAEHADSEGYFLALEATQQLDTLKAMFDGIGMCLDRRFFQYSGAEHGDHFFETKHAVSHAYYEARQLQQRLRAESLPIQEFSRMFAESDLSADSLRAIAKEIRGKINTLVIENFPNNADQRRLYNVMVRDVFSVIKASPETTGHQRIVMLMLETPGRFHEWMRYKTLARINENYTSGGVANIALADSLIGYGNDERFLYLMREFLDDQEFCQLLEQPVAENTAKEIFIGEVATIYQSRRDIRQIVEAASGITDHLTPGEAMREVGDLSAAMARGDVQAIIEICERIENKSIDLFHQVDSEYALEQILDQGLLVSKWGRGEQHNRFLGGGVYFWGAQQEDWLKADDVSLHLTYPVSGLALKRNRYNNTQRGYNSAQRWLYADETFLDSQKKFNILAMIPAEALVIKKYEEGQDFPLNNEGYSARRIIEVTDYDIQEARWVWRLDNHYIDYDTDYFVSPEKEAVLKEHLGDGIQIQRDVLSP